MVIPHRIGESRTSWRIEGRMESPKSYTIECVFFCFLLIYTNRGLSNCESSETIYTTSCTLCAFIVNTSTNLLSVSESLTVYLNILFYLPAKIMTITIYKVRHNISCSSFPIDVNIPR